MYKLFPILFFVFLLCKSAESQNLDSASVNIFEQQFSDSISQINEQNENLRKSRDYYNKGLQLLKNENYIEAIPYFNNAIIIDSIFFEAYFSRGKCHEDSDHILAIADYLKSFELDSTNLLPLYTIANLYFKTNKVLAEEMYATICSLNANEYKAFSQRGIIAFTNAKYEEAQQLFSQSLSIKKNPYTLNDRASCYRKLDKLDLAIIDYLAAIDLNPNLAFIYSNLGSVYANLGEVDRAISFYDLAISKDSNYAFSYSNKASVLLNVNEIEKAKIVLDKALVVDSKCAPVYNNIGVINHKLKKYNEAILAFDNAIKLDINYAKAYLNRGISKQMIRDEIGACFDWGKADELGIKVAKKYLSNDCE